MGHGRPEAQARMLRLWTGPRHRSQKAGPELSDEGLEIGAADGREEGRVEAETGGRVRMKLGEATKCPQKPKRTPVVRCRDVPGTPLPGKREKRTTEPRNEE